jgi:hypothetical protein
MWELVLGFLKPVFGIIDKVVPDKAAADKMKAELQAAALAGDFKEFEQLVNARAQIIVAEAKGDSWIQRSWRPIAMLCFVFIIMNNHAFAPYLGAMGLPVVILPTPPDLWAVIKLGLGGYVVGRSAEKIIPGVVEAIKGNK